MTGPWRVTTLAALLALGLASPRRSLKPPSPRRTRRRPSRAGARSSAKEAFGVDVTLTPKTIIYMKGNGNWDNALETHPGRLQVGLCLFEKQGLKRPARR